MIESAGVHKALQILDSMPPSLKVQDARPILAAPLHYFVRPPKITFKSRWQLAKLAVKIHGKSTTDAIPLVLDFLEQHQGEILSRRAALSHFFQLQFFREVQILTPNGLNLKATLYKWMLEDGYVMPKGSVPWKILQYLLERTPETMVRAIQIGGPVSDGAFGIQELKGETWEPNGQLPADLLQSMYGVILLASTFPPENLAQFFGLDLTPRYQDLNFDWLETDKWQITFGVEYQMVN